MEKAALLALGKALKQPGGSSAPFVRHDSKEHLVLAFFAGVLLTLLLLALVFLITKSCRKCKCLPSSLRFEGG